MSLLAAVSYLISLAAPSRSTIVGTSDQDATTPQPTAQCHFWKLPPELRTRIYEYALYQPGWCLLTKQHGIPEPALLLTCKFTRKEALGIFYAETNFRVDAPAFDPALYKMFARKDKIHPSYNHAVVSVYMDPLLPRHWQNLLAWLERHHAGNLPQPWLHGNFTLRFTVQEAGFIASLFAITSGLRERSWSEVEAVLVGLHSGLRALHGEWR